MMYRNFGVSFSFSGTEKFKLRESISVKMNHSICYVYEILMFVLIIMTVIWRQTKFARDALAIYVNSKIQQNYFNDSKLLWWKLETLYHYMYILGLDNH